MSVELSVITPLKIVSNTTIYVRQGGANYRSSLNGGDATIYCGTGGVGASITNIDYAGGVGNSGGYGGVDGKGNSVTYKGADGTGGLLILFVKGL